jgi:hypothetical protein
MASHASPAGSGEPFLPGSPEAKETTPEGLGAPAAPVDGDAKGWAYFAQSEDDDPLTDGDEDGDSEGADDSDDDSLKQCFSGEEADAEWEDLIAEDECPDEHCTHPQCQGFWGSFDEDEGDNVDGGSGDGSDDDGDSGYETP